MYFKIVDKILWDLNYFYWTIVKISGPQKHNINPTSYQYLKSNLKYLSQILGNLEAIQ